MAEQSDFSSQPETDLKYKILLEVSETVSKSRDLHTLCRNLAKLLPQIVKVDFMALDLHDPQRNVIKLFHIEANVPADIIGGHEINMDEHPAGTVFKTQKPLLVSDITQDNRYPYIFSRMREDGVNSICVFPLTTAVRKIGGLIFSSCEKGTYKEADFEFLDQVAKQVAVAVDNVLHFQELAKERDHSRLLLEVNNAVVSTLNLKELFASISTSLRRLIPDITTSLCLYDSDTQTFRRPVLDFPEGKGFIQARCGHWQR